MGPRTSYSDRWDLGGGRMRDGGLEVFRILPDMTPMTPLFMTNADTLPWSICTVFFFSICNISTFDSNPHHWFDRLISTKNNKIKYDEKCIKPNSTLSSPTGSSLIF